MDHPPKERPCLPLLGEPDPGHAWGAVHGWRGDLWCRCVSALPGTAKRTQVQTSFMYTQLNMYVFCVQEDIISIWNKTASDQATTARIRDTLRRVLNLPPNTIMEYKTHTDSIKYVCLPNFIFSLKKCSHFSCNFLYLNNWQPN